MDIDTLRKKQTPIKERYKHDPSAARSTLRARGTLHGEELTVRLDPPAGKTEAGLHAATGGDARWACSGDMLLESLAACAGITLQAVALSMGIPIRAGAVVAEGDLDWRGTLGVDKAAPVGFSAIRLAFDLDTDATPEQLKKLGELTERYCVVYQTLRAGPTTTTTVTRR